MKSKDALVTVFNTLVRNKIRLTLTVLGIVVGISSVVVISAIGRGTSRTIERQISAMGDNLLTIIPEKKRTGTVHGGLGSSTSLTFEDYDALKNELGHILSGVSPVIYGSCQILKEERNWNVVVYGVSWEYGRIRSRNVSEGSFFSESDEVFAEKVCVIGETVRDKLFNQDDFVVGSFIRIDRMPFKIIGILESKGANAFGRDQDDVILVPYTAAKAYVGKSQMSSVKMIDVSLHSMDDMDFAKDEIAALLRQRHNLSDDADDDFVFRDATEIMKARNSVSSLASLMLVILSGISLLVGGVGVMNVMLVSVTERINEIGLRMSIGASPKDILVQFLLESLVISILGGVIGILLGIGVSRLIVAILRWPVLITCGDILLALIFSSAVGLVFGFYPAYKASQMNPIECLRYEI